MSNNSNSIYVVTLETREETEVIVGVFTSKAKLLENVEKYQGKHSTFVWKQVSENLWRGKYQGGYHQLRARVLEPNKEM